MIDFKRIAEAALQSIDTLLAEWLPGGQREGYEYKALNPTRADQRKGSFSINLNSGAWADFATGDKGGDLISLRAFLFSETPKAAAEYLANRLSIPIDQSATPPARASSPPRKRSEWMPVLPVPDGAPTYPAAHIKRGKPQSLWEYRDKAGKLLFVVYRFTKSDGGKDVLPCCFAQNEKTGETKWNWMAPSEPRPLYALHRLRDEGTVLVVEGEKCTDAAYRLLGEASPVSVISWPGGGKAVNKADWQPLAGRKVVLWPDCDGQLDKAGIVIPEDKQPGVQAMERLADTLIKLGADVRIVKIPAPGVKADGWDVADAIAEGWEKQHLLDYIRNNLRTAQCAEPESTPDNAPRKIADDDQWQKSLLRNGEGKLLSVVPNAFRFLMHSEAWRDVLAYDEFAGRTIKQAPPPYMQGVSGAWTEIDDSFAADWLATRCGLIHIRAPMVAEAVEMVAKMRSFNPVKDMLESLRHDGVARVETWLSDFMGAEDTPYNRIVGRIWLVGMVKRAYEPGCKFDFMPILEGTQGYGKTTALEVLAGSQWFGNTDFVMGDKDSMSVLQGKWIYEIAELDAFNKADITRVKSFVTRTKDEYRPAYGRRHVEQLRRVVLVGTTNQEEYFKDLTGNRRFLPIKIVSLIDTVKLAAMRELLLAEAVALYRSGSKVYPTREEMKIIMPEQAKREMSDFWLDAIEDYVNSSIKNEISPLDIARDCLKMDYGHITVPVATRIGLLMRKSGWEKVERRTRKPRFVYIRTQKAEEITEPDGNGGEKCPF